MTTARQWNGSAATMSPDQLAVARLLTDRGPIPGYDAADLLGWTVERWWNAVGRSAVWFDVKGNGWFLTEAGRSAACSTAEVESA